MRTPPLRIRQTPILVRPRLLRRLAGPWKVVLLAAPAGYRKSTLAGQHAGRRAALWCRLEREDRDLTHLMGHLVARGLGLHPPMGVRTQRLLVSRRDMERDGRLLATSLLEELVPPRGSRLVVIEEVHLLAEARDALAWLRRLLDESGPRVRFLLTCRGACPLPLARFELQGGVVEIGSEDLEFNDEEQGKLLRSILGRRPSETELSRLRAVVGGRPAGPGEKRLTSGPIPISPLRSLPGSSSGSGRTGQGAVDLAASGRFLSRNVPCYEFPGPRGSPCREGWTIMRGAGEDRAIEHDLIVVANPVWETAWSVPELPIGSFDPALALDRIDDGGGSAINTACAIASAGRRVLAVGRVGDDEAGHGAIEALRRRGVETRIEVLRGRATKRNHLYVERSTRATAFQAILPTRRVPPWEEVPPALLDARFLLLDRLAASAPGWLKARRGSGLRRNALNRNAPPFRGERGRRFEDVLVYLDYLQIPEGWTFALER